MEGFENGKTEGAMKTTKTNKILHTRTGKGRRKLTNRIKDNKGNRLNKLLTKLE